MTLEEIIEIPDATPLQEAKAVLVTVTNPEHPFGGVVIRMPAEVPVLVTLNQGGGGATGPHPITSVFGRLGDIQALLGDYDQFYAPLAAAVPTGGAAGQALVKLGNDDYNLGWGDLLGDIPLEDFARLSLPNVFQQVNTFHGFRLAPRIITEAYSILPTDSEILVDCSVNDEDIALLLPLSNGNGQVLHVKKIDDTDHVVSVNRQGADLIDGAISTNLGEKGADTLMSAAAPGYWSNWGPDLFDVLALPVYLDKFRLLEDGETFLFNPDMNTFHAVRVRGADNDSLYLEIDAGVA